MAASTIELYLNNGDIFNVATLCSSSKGLYPSNAYGLVMESNGPVCWLNLQNYVNNNWEAHYSGTHPYGWFGSLETRDTKINHKAALDNILNNGVFIWGDAYNGGLYLFKSFNRAGYTNNALYAFALFCGYGEDENDPNYERFSIKDWSTFDSRDYESLCAFSLVMVGDLDADAGGVVIPSSPFKIITAGEADRHYEVDGERCIRNAIANKTEVAGIYTNYDYVATPNIFKITDAWQTFPDYPTIRPVNPLKPSYVIPDEVYYTYIAAYGNNGYCISGSQSFSYPSSEQPNWAGYNISGDWAGGSGNQVPSDPNQGGGINTTGGGYGTPSKQSDRSGDTGEHQFDEDGTDVGCFTIFNPTKSELTAFNSWLFQSMFDAGLESIWNNLKKMYADPSEYIIGVGLIKYHPDKQASASEEIQFANVGTGVSARTVKQWTELEMGSIKVNEQYKSFLDYQGFSTVKIYLPFCGTYDLDQNDIMDSEISLKYNIDNLTGACVAVVDVKRTDRGKWDDSNIHSKIYRFNGNCMQQLPVTAKDYSTALTAVNGLCASVVSGAASAATGNAIGVIGGVAGAVSAATNMSPNIIQSGKISDAYGMLDCLKPFIILHRPIRSIPDQYGKHAGYPSMLFRQIGTFKGFTKARVDGTWTNTFPCTDEEKVEIQRYLESGIMLPE